MMILLLKNKKGRILKTEILELFFEPKESSLDKLTSLRRHAELINKLEVLGEGAEHDSTHYLEDTYFKWIKDNIKVKFYWDDRDEKQFCLEISFSDKNAMLELIAPIKKYFASK